MLTYCLFWLCLRFDRNILLALIWYESRLHIRLVFDWLLTKHVIPRQFKLLIRDLYVVQLFKPWQILEDVHSVVSQIRA